MEDFVIDGDQVDLMDEFLAANGRKAIMFFYQEAEVPVARESCCVSTYVDIHRSSVVALVLLATCVHFCYTDNLHMSVHHKACRPPVGDALSFEVFLAGCSFFHILHSVLNLFFHVCTYMHIIHVSRCLGKCRWWIDYFDLKSQNEACYCH